MLSTAYRYLDGRVSGKIHNATEGDAFQIKGVFVVVVVVVWVCVVVGGAFIQMFVGSARGLLTEMAQAVRAPDCPWRDVTRLVLEVAPCR